MDLTLLATSEVRNPDALALTKSQDIPRGIH